MVPPMPAVNHLTPTHIKLLPLPDKVRAAIKEALLPQIFFENVENRWADIVEACPASFFTGRPAFARISLMWLWLRSTR